MNINIYGLGYVGCISAACLAKDGHNVTGIDIDNLKVDIINDGKSPIVEPDLDNIIKNAVESGRLKATTNSQSSADISIVCVGTPSNKNGSLNFSYLEKVAGQIGNSLKNINSYHVVNIRSTVIPGTVEKLVIPILEKYSQKKAGKDFGVCMNPEFMREGTSIYDYYNPPFTVIGEIDKRSGDVVASLYSHVNAQIFRDKIKVAEMVKYSCNAFHALKITFANEVGNICKLLGIDSHKVMDIFSEDKKLNLSKYYLKPGFAFGGSCLPKDVRAIQYVAKSLDLETPVLSSLLPSNEYQIKIAYDLVNKIGKKKIGFLGLSFKPGTDDLRESPMVELIEKLIGKGFDVLIHDQEVSMAKIFGSNKRYIESVIPHISSLMCASPAEVLEGSEIIVLSKKTKEYEDCLNNIPEGKNIIDLDRINFDPKNKNTLYEGICW